MQTPFNTQRHEHFLAKVWALTKPYWTSEERWSAWGLLALIVALSLGSVYISVLINGWYNAFYDALQGHDVDAFWHLIGRFSLLAAAAIVAAIYQYYFTSMLQIRWRRWLTHVYFERWLGRHAYYQMEMRHDATDNPDQRISEDIDRFTDATLNLSLGLLTSIVTLVSFVTILWAISGPLTFVLAGHEVVIPGYMVWVAIVYAGLGSWLTHLVGRRLIRLNFVQQRYEADLRFAMARLRENAEGVALYGGEQAEKRRLRQRFGHVWENFWSIMRTQKRLIGFTSGYGQIAIIFPLVVAAPRYFSGAIQLGALMQISNAFGRVQDALSWFVDSYAALASWRSVVDRLIGFNEHLDALAPSGERPDQRLERATHQAFQLHDLTLRLPDGSVLATVDKLTLERGSNILFTAPSGSGKSVLFRVLAGIWPWWQGRIARPDDVMFLPQTPYLPIATLREALAYPESAERYREEDYVEVLQQCRLTAFIDQLDRHDHWAQRLSPGEQQRVAIARALLKRPAWLFLDEATAALDVATEQHLYSQLERALPDTTLVSIAHRDSLARFHSRRLYLEGDATPALRLDAGSLSEA